MALFSPRLYLGAALFSLSVLALGCGETETAVEIEAPSQETTAEEVVEEDQTEAIAAETSPSPVASEDKPQTASNTPAQSQPVTKKPTATTQSTTTQGGGGVEATLGTIEYNLGPYRTGFGAPHTEATYGVLLNTQTAITTYDLPAGSYAVGAACGDDCEAISLQILNSDGISVASKDPSSNLPDNELLFFFDTRMADTYTAIITMDECLTEGCHYGINAYRGFDESN